MADLATYDVDRGRHGGVGRHAHAEQLVGPPPQGVEHRRVDRAEPLARDVVDHRVVGALPPHRAVHQLGGERGIAAGDVVLGEHRGQHQIDVGVALADRGEDVVRRRACRVDLGAIRPSEDAEAGAGLDAARRGPSPRRPSASCRTAFTSPSRTGWRAGADEDGVLAHLEHAGLQLLGVALDRRPGRA